MFPAICAPGFDGEDADKGLMHCAAAGAGKFGKPGEIAFTVPRIIPPFGEAFGLFEVAFFQQMLVIAGFDFVGEGVWGHGLFFQAKEA